MQLANEDQRRQDAFFAQMTAMGICLIIAIAFPLLYLWANHTEIEFTQCYRQSWDSSCYDIYGENLVSPR